MARIVFVTDSASDLDPAVAMAHGIRVVPLVVSFGSDTYRAGVDLSTAAFWERMTAPDAPFPKTAASSPGEFKAVYDGVFAEGADSIVSVHIAGTLSGAIKSAEIARSMLPDREIHIVDSKGASMAESIAPPYSTSATATPSRSTGRVAAWRIIVRGPGRWRRG